MAKVYQGKCSIVMNTKGKIALKRDADGAFGADNAAECLTTMQSLAEEHKAEIDSYSFWQVKGGTVPVMLANRWGGPYIGLLPKSDKPAASNKPRITKLA